MSMNNFVTIYNAPPGAGKDTAVDLLLSSKSITAIRKKFQFKDPLYEITSAIYRIPLEEFIEMATDRTAKNVPVDRLDGLSPREALIEVSESVIKPFYGKDFFGNAAVADITSTPFFDADVPFLSLFSDGGFKEEAIPVIDAVGADKCLIIRLFREGCDYTGDSRRYLTQEDVGGVRIVDIENNGTQEELLNQSIDAITQSFSF